MIHFDHIERLLSAPHNITRQRTSSEKVRAIVLTLLKNQHEITISEVSEEVGISKGSASKYMHEMVVSGLLSRREFSVREINAEGQSTPKKYVFFRLAGGE